MPTIDPDKWGKIKEIFYAALQLPPDERERFVTDSCGDDGDLRQEVESLLSVSGSAGSFMQGGAVGEVAEMIAGGQNLQPGTAFSHYQILKLIGQGGMGEVYLAHDEKLRRPVALKVVRPRAAGDEDRIRRFEQEARSAS